MRFEGWRVGEVAVSYRPRTFSEGKKIRWTDGVRALYCVFHYNASSLPLPMQLVIYFFIGLVAAIVNLAAFALLEGAFGMALLPSVAIAFAVAAAVNYLLCIALLFRHKSRWQSLGEMMAYAVAVILMGALDYGVTAGLMRASLFSSFWAKALSNMVGFFGNFFMRKFFVFGNGPPASLTQPRSPA